jgi:type I restriction-modification system specificity subunit
MSRNKSPRLRFGGFTGEWEEKKLEDFSPLQRGFDLPVSKIVEGDYPVVFSNGILKTHNQYKVKGVGVVTGRSGTIGEVTFVEKDFWPHNTALWVTNFFDNDPQFVFQFLKNFDLSRFATGSGVPTLNRNDVHDQIIYAPKREEQTALGNFFRRLDETLAQARARLAKTQQLKKAMLAKLFPQHNEPAPKLRFKGFSGDWERRALGEVVNVFDNLRIPVAENARIAGSTPYFGANGIQDYVDGFTHDGEFVLIAEDGANDLQNYPVQYFNGKGWVNNHAHVLQGKPEFLNNLFLFSRFQSMDISRFLVGGGRAKLNGSTMLEIEIEFPKDKKEQTAIGNFFQKLDQTLALQSAALEKLTNLKKALLAAMLV